MAIDRTLIWSRPKATGSRDQTLVSRFQTQPDYALGRRINRHHSEANHKDCRV
jgi:hypothetical protein